MRRLGGLVLALLLAACAPFAPLPEAPVPAGPAITVEARPVDAAPPGHVLHACPGRCGTFTYAGGLELSARDTSRLHGLSDLDVTADGRLTAVSDDGDLFTARLVLQGGRLAGVTEGRLSPLTGLDGQPIGGKEWGDAEGLAVLPSGDRLVSFEHRDRVWLYPRAGGPPRAVASPEFDFPANGGMEALSADGADGYLTAAENTGETWTCRLEGPCVPGPVLEKPPEFGAVSVRRLADGRTVWLLRAWDALRGNRIVVRLSDRSGRTIDTLALSRPATVDNFEGLAVLPRPGGGLRLYLLSDDNFQPIQRTLLMAFDWTPWRGR